MPSLAGGGAPGQAEEGQTDPTSRHHRVAARCRASAATRRPTTGPEEDAEQNYKKTVVFRLVVGKRAGTARSLVPRC